MAKNKGYPRQRRPTLDEQIYRMRVVWPDLQLRNRKRQVEATWKGAVQPAPMCERYVVWIRYRHGYSPEVHVLNPKLKIREGASCLPHVYDDGGLCLHDYGEWESWMFVADYFVPWISSWLYFYEVWYAVGLWLGGGTHPDKPEHRAA